MKALVPILCLAVLAACATPAERCQREATRDLRAIDRDIFQARRNLALGYDEERQTRFGFCLGGGSDNVGVSLCADDLFDRARARRDFDVTAERMKLARLIELREVEAERARRALALCPAPEPDPGGDPA